jgi:hypothetical protein
MAYEAIGYRFDSCRVYCSRSLLTASSGAERSGAIGFAGLGRRAHAFERVL